MIAFLTGTLAAMDERTCTLLTPGGVGYEIQLAAKSLASLPQRGGEICFHVHLVVREDALELFGFESREERDAFRTLISISGFGPRKAQAVINQYTPEELTRIVVEEDVAALTRISGIGKKTAQQMLLELRFKLDKKGHEAHLAGTPQQSRGVFKDALAGLVNLGYSEEEAAPILRGVLEKEPDLDVAAALRKALQAIARARS
ncbi:Holliday junction ATP-dependent DNA helicase ruvA [Desulfovibrio sp. X2]|uniref:Holliday junction branch migration protein RuvA n=1 Tax=Desulfovibrio sp. X2 TaxID=941449 RepID=UPI000358F39F|nr:Holliday junction branch migration protein RuvA [Desulfovibrio sp. X2]EPR42743.1 Holliday junction ATP-dependent DNA helicase ruvA [Desulfovibrio sp. X2]